MIAIEAINKLYHYSVILLSIFLTLCIRSLWLIYYTLHICTLKYYSSYPPPTPYPLEATNLLCFFSFYRFDFLNELGQIKSWVQKLVTMTTRTYFKVALILVYYQSSNQAVQRICTRIQPQLPTRLRMRLSGQCSSPNGKICQGERSPLPCAHCLFHHWLRKGPHQHARIYLPA